MIVGVGHHGGIAEQEIAVGVGGVAVEVERVVVRQVVAAVEEHDHQTIEGGIAHATVVQLDELERIGTWRIRVDLVDQRRRCGAWTDVGCAWGGCNWA